MAYAGTGTETARPLQVLVVDDSQALRARVRLALEQAGLTVVGEAADGAQALTQAAAHQPDVVLMDPRIPWMDGIQTTRILRRRQPDTPVVLWSADYDARLDRAIRESGAQVGIPKEIDPVELVTTLRGVCDAQDARDAVDDQDEVGTPPAARDGRVDPSPTGLAAAEWAALEQLEASDGYATRWPVGRQVTRSLVDRGLVVVASDYVLLTEAGRRALATDNEPRDPPDPPETGRVGHDVAARPARTNRGLRRLRAGLVDGGWPWSLTAVASTSPRLLRG
jgi:CheY-like chemotaxis protein